MRPTVLRLLVSLGLALAAASAHAADACPGLLDHTLPRLQDDKPQSLCDYRGKVVLIVNTASYCGFTGQYDGLEKLYARLQARGLVVLGFPSNDFGNQEPGSAKEIAEFCTNTYGVKFPMFAKSHVRGSDANPLHKELIALSGTTPKWNFYKYVIDRKGQAVDSFCALLGSFAGSVALVLGARGGVYIGGGIVPRFPEFFAASPFRARFEHRGRFTAYLQPIPCFVIHAPDAALRGAAAALD